MLGCIRLSLACGGSVSFVIVYDCEFLTGEASPSRFWCGPQDPDPLCVQIGAVRLDLSAPYDVSEPVGWFVTPQDRDGNVTAIDPMLTRLCGITQATIDTQGVPLIDALGALGDFAQGNLLLSWGKDELLCFAPSLFVQGLTSPIPAPQFRNAAHLLVAAGEDVETVNGLRSNTICAYFGLKSTGRAHDARADAAGVATALSHLLQTGRLRPEHITGLAPN